MWSRSARADVAAALADTVLVADWARPALLEAGALVLGRRPRWLPPVVTELLAAYREAPVDRRREVARLIESRLAVLQAQGRLTVRPPRIKHREIGGQGMGPMRWPVPELDTVAALARFLDLHVGELYWLADPRGLERTVDDERLRNYRYGWLPRAGRLPRPLERPKRLLKECQRRVLHEILDRIPAHPDAHGFRKGHSTLTHACRHLGAHVLLQFDLEDFFTSVEAGRVYGIFRAAGYPESVAWLLTGLCTNVMPAAEWPRALLQPAPGAVAASARLRLRLASPHLPQGAPTSPALASLCALGLDRRLSALALGTGCSYSRYADDLTLSGGRWLLAHADAIRATVAAVVREEGFRLNERKSRLTTQADRQTVTGIVVNQRPNPSRRDYDRLKAVLHDAALHRPVAANRPGTPEFRAHLLGRIARVGQLNPTRGEKLRRLFDSVDWA